MTASFDAIASQCSLDLTGQSVEPLAPGAVVLRRFVTSERVLQAVNEVIGAAPLRHMTTPGGFRMSVAMTNCGSVGWVTDLTGYRYDERDPLTQRPWPAMPAALLTLAQEAAAAGGFPGFVPDACLINRYDPGARMSLHQDKDEADFGAPIVSVSLGLPAVFLFGGDRRSDRPVATPIEHGDVVVWGGPSRLRFHGVRPVKDGVHPLLGRQRLNLTFRRASE